MARTSNWIAARVFTLLALVAAGAAGCAGGKTKAGPDAGIDVAADTSKPDLAKPDTNAPDLQGADTGSSDVRPDVSSDIVTTDVQPDLGPPDVVSPVDVPTANDASTIDTSVAPDAGSSNPDGSTTDAPLSTGPGLANPRTVPVTASTPLAVAAGAMLPANNATGVPIDTLLRIGFDAPPTLGTSGIVAIHLASNGAIVDSINVADTYAIYSGGTLTSASLNTSRVNIIGNVAGAGVSQVRVVNYVPIFVDGNTVTIVPHNNKLAYATAYYVTIDSGLVAGTISATTFTGISAPTGWTFTTKAVAPTTLNVAADNSADFATVQGAIDSFAPGSTARTINIAPGVYQEMLFLRSKNNVTLKGTNNGLDAVIQYDNSDPFNPGVGQGQTVTGGTIPGLGTTTQGPWTAGGRAVFLLSSASGVVLDGVTIKNLHAQGSLIPPPPNSPTYTGYTPSSAAEVIYFNASQTGTLVAKHSNFISYQDTLQLKGVSWFYDSFVTGDTDFIWGNANIALFEQCEIKSRINGIGSSVVNSRAILGSGTPATPASYNTSFAGFVFLNSALTKEAGTFTAYLARSAGVVPAATGTPFLYSGYDIVSYIGCSMDAHIPAVGWNITGQTNTMGANVRPNPVTGWREYHSVSPSGQLLDVSQRLPDSTPPDAGAPPAGSIQLSDANVTTFFPNRATIFGGATDGTFTTTALVGFAPVP
jgi:pectin methylesterase-like acyl-CoA thioesterase